MRRLLRAEELRPLPATTGLFMSGNNYNNNNNSYNILYSTEPEKLVKYYIINNMLYILLHIHVLHTSVYTCVVYIYPTLKFAAKLSCS